MPILRNPYLNRSMIRSVGDFHGRVQVIQRLMARIGSPTPQSVSIVGERRVGKSSLLWHIAQPEIHARYLDHHERYIFLLLDFQRQQYLDQSGFCRVFGEHLQEATNGETPIPEDFTQLERVIQDLARADRRLVCLCDEFETVTRNTGFGPEFFGFLRSMANTYPVAFVTASRRDLQSLCHTREIAESPFFNIFSQVPLGPLRPAEIKQLVCEPSATAGLPLEPYQQQIFGLSGYLPFFAQIASSSAFECLMEDEDQQLDNQLLEQRFLEEASSHFHYLWENFDTGERAVVRALISSTEPPAQHAAELRGLTQHGYALVEADKVRLFSSAFGRFLTESFPEETPPPPSTPKPTAAVPDASPSPQKTQGITYTSTITPLPKGEHPFPRLVGNSEAMRRLFALMQKATQSDATVLISGETGCGKELVARCVHDHSERNSGPFVAVNCGAIAENLQESELFGHVRGAFTDAVSDRQGLFEEADGGTIFLDEIGEALPSIQVKLLRVLQEGEIRRVGDNQIRQVNVRLICATNRDLEEEVSQGRFREDLYYRLFVLPLFLPPLRQRREDIPLLVEHFLREDKNGIGLDAQEILNRALWPGNIRELENQITSAMAMASGEKIRSEHLWSHLRQTAPLETSESKAEHSSNANTTLQLPVDQTLKEARTAFERELVIQRLQHYGDDLETTATSLGISRSRLYELIRRYNLKSEDGA